MVGPPGNAEVFAAVFKQVNNLEVDHHLIQRTIQLSEQFTNLVDCARGAFDNQEILTGIDIVLYIGNKSSQ